MPEPGQRSGLKTPQMFHFHEQTGAFFPTRTHLITALARRGGGEAQRDDEAEAAGWRERGQCLRVLVANCAASERFCVALRQSWKLLRSPTLAE